MVDVDEMEDGDGNGSLERQVRLSTAHRSCSSATCALSKLSRFNRKDSR